MPDYIKLYFSSVIKVFLIPRGTQNSVTLQIATKNTIAVIVFNKRNIDSWQWHIVKCKEKIIAGTHISVSTRYFQSFCQKFSFLPTCFVTPFSFFIYFPLSNVFLKPISKPCKNKALIFFTKLSAIFHKV